MRTLRLPDILDLRAASPLAANLLAIRGHQATIDASHVQRVGAQCVQVLLSARVTWAADSVSFVLSNPSEAFLEGVGTLGIPIAKFSEQELSR
ncbi:MAG: STAS domain-containing protein [Methylocystis sp.]|nr:STAS domain-containing protein [Methylocystis sp.]